MSKHRMTSYLYFCHWCKRNSIRGSSAKRCDLLNGHGHTCYGLLDRVKTVKGPIPVKLKVHG
jgi:hypothetical protein